MQWNGHQRGLRNQWLQHGWGSSVILSEVSEHSTSVRWAHRASRRSTLRDREKNSTIWSAVLDELNELAELDDQKRLFTDAPTPPWTSCPIMYRHRQASPRPLPMPTFADLQDCLAEMDAPLHQSSGRTATPPVSVKLTLQITLIPSPTGWTVSLSEHFPHIPMVPAPPQPREPPPNDFPKLPYLRGGTWTSRSPQPPRQSRLCMRPMLSTMPWEERTMSADSYGSIYRQETPGDYRQESRYNQQTPLKTNRKRNRNSLDTSTQNFYRCLTPIQSNTWNGQSSEKNRKHVQFSSPPPSWRSRRHHWRK